ncbi:RNA-guided endonuclease IscB [Chloroflexota bacterium]
MQQEHVYVQDANGEPLMPTKRFGAVRRWLKSGRAVAVSREPFTIRLVDRKGGYVQPVEAGIDLGTGHVGVSIISETEELFAGEFILRSDISKLLTDRRMFRRSRRGRKLRYRPPRFLNRKHQDELAPSVRAKVDETLKIIDLIVSMLPVTHWTFESGNFDPHRLANPDVTDTGYQQGEQYGFANVREYVLHRDRHTCQNPKCAKIDPILTVHHIRSRGTEGSDRPANLLTLCRICHREHHNGQPLQLKAPPSLRAATQFNVLKSSIIRATTHLNRDVTFGYITKSRRIALALSKSHVNDAFVIAGGTDQQRTNVQYLGQFFRRQNRKLRKGARSHIRNTIPHAFGFKRGDRVRLPDGRECFIFGLRSSGQFDVRKLIGEVLSHSISYKKLYRLERAKTLRIEKIGGVALSSPR